MSQDTDDTRARILGVAEQMGQPDTPATQTATTRGWLDKDGAPTDQGRQMLEDLDAQQGTRSVFRG